MVEFVVMNETKQPQPIDDGEVWKVPVTAAFLPFLVWPIEMLLPYPWLVEELAKGWLVWRVLKQGANGSWQMAISVGLLFGASEMLLYTVNAILAGSLAALGLRVLLTVPMHMITVLLMYWLGKKGTIWFGVGLGAGMLVHWGFNMMVGLV